MPLPSPATPPMPVIHIPETEYLDRRCKLQKKLQQANVTHYVATSSESIYYLCGASYEALERPFLLIVPAAGDAILIVPVLERDHLKKAKAIKAEQIFCYFEFPAKHGEGWLDALDLHGKLQSGFLYDETCPMSIAQHLQARNGRASDLIATLRMVKSQNEIAMIRRAAHYADIAVSQLFAYSYFGSSVAEGFARTSHISQQIIKNTEGWDPLTSKVLMATFPAPYSAMPHSIPDARAELRAGPHVTLVLTRVNGYSAECERTYFTSAPTAEELELFDLMVAARRLGLSMLRPGVACAEIDASINRFLAQHGFAGPQRRLHRTGHGFGLGSHEGPWLAEGSSDILEAGMVVSMEPGIYLQGKGGYRHSDTILITENAYELLTTAAGIDAPLVFGKQSLKHKCHRYLVHRALGLSA